MLPELLRSFIGNQPNEDVELQDLLPLLDGIDFTDDDSDNLEILLKRIQEQVGSEIPECISRIVGKYLEWLKSENIELKDSPALTQHYVALVIYMFSLLKRLKGMRPASWPFSTWTPSTTEQIKNMREDGPKKITQVTDEIYAELEVMYETATEKNKREGTVVSMRELAEKRLMALQKTKEYRDEIAKIEAACNKVESQSDKELLVIYKFALKAVAALLTAFLVLYGWLSKNEPVEPVPVPSQP